MANENKPFSNWMSVIYNIKTEIQDHTFGVDGFNKNILFGFLNTYL